MQFNKALEQTTCARDYTFNWPTLSDAFGQTADTILLCSHSGMSVNQQKIPENHAPCHANFRLFSR